MPQSARLLVSRALATAIAGPPRLDAFGLTIVRSPSGPSARCPSHLRASSTGSGPAGTTPLEVTNPARLIAAARFGQLLIGGIADTLRDRDHTSPPAQRSWSPSRRCLPAGGTRVVRVSPGSCNRRCWRCSAWRPVTALGSTRSLVPLSGRRARRAYRPPGRVERRRLGALPGSSPSGHPPDGSARRSNAKRHVLLGGNVAADDPTGSGRSARRRSRRARGSAGRRPPRSIGRPRLA